MNEWLSPESGTYKSGDVRFLLKDSNAPVMSVADKEAAIQSGSMHYSECITDELAPNAQYLAYYKDAMSRSGDRLAQDVLTLYQGVLKDVDKHKKVIWVSLARAGTPIGVLLHRHSIENGLDSVHYSVSIVRDKGLDLSAIAEIALVHDDLSQLIFVDGWTGKGTITRELKQSVAKWNAKNGQQIVCRLAVIADPCGWADYAATHEDYLVPNAVLNSTVSGCVSRTTCLNENDVHGARFFEALVQSDVSKDFIVDIELRMKSVVGQVLVGIDKSVLRSNGKQWFEEAKAKFNARSDNHLKPGIPETTRVMLRRKPKLICVRNEKDQDVAHLIFLAKEMGVELRVEKGMPYAAIGLIDGLQGD
jgi:hypothetical protein